MPSHPADLDQLAADLAKLANPPTAVTTTSSMVETRAGGWSLPAPVELFAPIGLVESLDYEDLSPDVALTCSAVYSAVSLIASAIGTLPIHLRERKKESRVDQHPVSAMLMSPNEDMTPSDFMEAFCLNLLTSGNGTAYVERDSLYEPVALYPLKSIQTDQRRRGRLLVYMTRVRDRTFTLRPDQVVHAKNLSWDGVRGISPLRCGAGAVGLSLLLDRFARKFFEQGAAVRSVIELPPMKPDALNEFKRKWHEEYAGWENAHKTAAAPGLKVHKMGVSPEESQADQARIFQLREVARIYQIPPHKLGDLEKSSFSNIEEQERQWAIGTLRRWTVKIEQALEKTLLTERDRERLKIRFNLAALIRGTFKDQIEALSKATGGAPVYTVNEAREYLGLPPRRGGNDLMSNLNQTPAQLRHLQEFVQVTAQSIATKELNAARRAATRADNFETWSADYFSKHVDHLVQRLPMVSRVHAREMAESARSRLELAHRRDCLDAELADWTRTRTAEITEDLLQRLDATGSPGNEQESQEDDVPLT